MISIVLENITNRLLFKGGRLDETGYTGNGFNASQYTTANARQIEIESLPEEAILGQSTYNEINDLWTHPAGSFSLMLDSKKDSAKETLANIAEAKLEGGFVWNGVPVDTSEKGVARLNMGKQKTRASRKVVTSRGKGRANLTSAQFDALYDAIEANGKAIMDNWYDLLEAIDNATTTAELEAVDINAGWPA